MKLGDRIRLTRWLREHEPGLSPAEMEARIKAIDANDKEQRDHYIAKANLKKWVPFDHSEEFPNDDIPF